MSNSSTNIVRTRTLLLAPATFILLIAAILPLGIVVIYSFLTPGDYGGVVWKFSTDGWVRVVAKRDMFTSEIGFATDNLMIFWRSISLSIVTTILTLIVGFPIAYFIATRPRRTRDVWMLLVMIPFWTNLLIRTFAIMQLFRNEGTVNSILLGLGLVDKPLQMLYTDFAVLVGMVYVYLPLMVLPIYSAMERFDFRIAEAAYDLYAPRSKVLTKVILPIVKPGIVAGIILVFVPSLGAYVTPRVLGGGKQLMLGNLIEMQFGQVRNWPLGAALSITLVVVVAIALFLHARSSNNVGDSK
ncbi:ABC transporter permease [Rhizobium sp. KVB221]|uniref:ABC transporter permease n=1 Tax=Rhizobium setariae TaxID=2801340 RepID=A0A936YQD2_9HYPH|nr:ABC transporter permease [Rhizobium setariae]MBL0372289.1 ABC transporter permease [Rhizobium setariae]